MDTSANTISSSSQNFNFDRIELVARYYTPSLNAVYVAYPLISLVLGILSYWVARYGAIGSVFATFFISPLAFMLYLGPLALARKSNQTIEALIPATWQEKSTFALLYTFIVLPILTYAPFALIRYVVCPLLFGQTEDFTLSFYNDLLAKTYGVTYYLAIAFSVLQYFVPTITCLYSVTHRRNNRVGMSIVWSLVSWIGLSFVSGIVAIVITLMNIPMLRDLNTHDAEALVSERLADNLLVPTLIISGVISVIYIIAMTCLTIRSIRKSQY